MTDGKEKETNTTGFPRTKAVKIRILVVDDERGARMALEVPLRLSGYEVTAVSNAEAGLELGQKIEFDVLLTDVYMPGINGLELVQKFQFVSPQTKIIVMTAQGSLETALKAVQLGAFDFIAKPFNIEDVLALISRATENKPLQITPDEAAERDFSASGIVGHSPQMVRVYKLIAAAARTDATVLIEGETGTGKELAARAIHNHSSRAAKPFIAVNCSALTDTLLESELFGYMKGSFTGANADHAGLFESASGGTIFLDEIGTANSSLQAALLRVIQEREVRRIGSSEARKIDVRIIAATNTTLEKLVERKEFRQDLFYRLSVLTIQLPPLRGRGREDLELLVRHLLKKNAEKTGASLKIAEDTVDALARYEWAGNVRELENAIEYAAAVCSNGLITNNDLPPRILSQAASQTVNISSKMPLSLADDRPLLEELTRRYVQLILAENEGNKSRAAEILGINRRTLYRFLDVAEDGIEIEADETADNSA
jgi:DNA-binding NtrC family response regulator